MNHMNGSRFVTGSEPATVTSMSVYLKAEQPVPTRHLRRLERLARRAGGHQHVRPADRQLLEHPVLDDPQPLQDYGCFLPEDPFALPRTLDGSAG
jgi:hypothetical protein